MIADEEFGANETQNGQITWKGTSQQPVCQHTTLAPVIGRIWLEGYVIVV
jgi:hypothetical protein